MSFFPSRALCLSLLASLLLTTQAAVPSDTYVIRPGGNSNSNSNITVVVNVPSGDSNELFFHFSAPASNSYAAFGIGSRMKGSLMFIAYPSENGNNITLSPRLGTGNTMPQHTDSVQVEVLSGSGIIDNAYVVNAKCSNCRTWSGGSADVQSERQSMIWALGDSDEIKSNALDATIRQHSTYDTFDLDFKKATGDAGVPIADASTDNTDIVGGGPGGGGPSGSRRGIAFHAFLMVAAFLVVFPAGYLFLRVFEKVWLHWAVQSFALLMVAIGTGVGIAISKRENISPNLTHGHQILGFVILGLLLMTWGVGLTGHILFRRTGKPAQIMKGHRVLGPASMSLGLTNCFVGFRFADNTRGAIVLGIATLLMIIFVASVVFFSRRRKMRKGAMNTPAAYNFREGQMGGPAPYGPQSPSMPSYGQGGIPLHSYENNQPPPVYR